MKNAELGIRVRTEHDNRGNRVVSTTITTKGNGEFSVATQALGGIRSDWKRHYTTSIFHYPTLALSYRKEIVLKDPKQLENPEIVIFNGETDITNKRAARRNQSQAVRSVVQALKSQKQ